MLTFLGRLIDFNPSLMFELIKNKQIGFYMFSVRGGGQKTVEKWVRISISHPGDCISGGEDKKCGKKMLSRMLLLFMECVYYWQSCGLWWRRLSWLCGRMWRKPWTKISKVSVLCMLQSRLMEDDSLRGFLAMILPGLMRAVWSAPGDSTSLSTWGGTWTSVTCVQRRRGDATAEEDHSLLMQDSPGLRWSWIPSYMIPSVRAALLRLVNTLHSPILRCLMPGPMTWLYKITIGIVSYEGVITVLYS